MSTAQTVLVVCTANICRSPMGEGLLAHALAAQAAPLKNLRVLSAGVFAQEDALVSANSVAALKKVGLDIAGHRARQLTQPMLDEALLVLVMTEAHKAMIELQAAPAPRELYLFRDFMAGTASREIADPYGGALKYYEQSRDEMVEAIPGILEHLKRLTAS